MSSAHTQAFTPVPFLHPYGTAPGGPERSPHSSNKLISDQISGRYNPQYSEHFGSPSALLPAATSTTPQQSPTTPQSSHAKQTTRRTSPSDVDINFPSWTALSAEGTSDDEDLNLLNSHTMIVPKPAKKDSTQQGAQGESHPQGLHGLQLKPEQPQPVYCQQVVPTGPAAR